MENEKIKIFDKQTNTIKEYQKSQFVRLYDVFLLAPFLLYVGYNAKGISQWQRYGVYFIAVSTIWYNGRNYLKNIKKLKG